MTLVHEGPGPTRMGPVRLVVADADTSIGFYRDVLGLSVLRREPSLVELGSGGRVLVRLTVAPGTRRKAASTTGLYHVALLLPDRPSLGAFVRSAVERGVPLGSADHLVSEALYLDDPDGNGIEVYRDRPRSQWRSTADGQVVMASRVLDLAGLVAEADAHGASWSAAPEETAVGHVHLQVDDLPAARRLYGDVLGFDVRADLSPMGALFFGADGYHHHIGSNTWTSRGGPPPGRDTATIRSLDIAVPAAARDAVEARARAAGMAVRATSDAVELDDPWGATVRVTS